MKGVIVTILVALLPLIYLNTAIVVSEGDGGSVLVYRALHGHTPFYGGGEEGSWRRAHPNQPVPWWQTGSFTRIAAFDDEATMSPFILAYGLGYYATVLCIIGLIIYYSWRHGAASRAAAIEGSS